MTFPPVNRAIGQRGHVDDHNKLATLVQPSTFLDLDLHFAGSLALAVAEAESSGGPSTLIRLPRHLEVSATQVIGRGITLQGAGTRGTIIEPAAGFSGWCFDVQDAGRNGQWQIDDTLYDETVDQSGPEFRDLMIVSPDRANAAKGIRVARADDLLMDNVQLGNLRGTALQLGNDAAAITVEGVRESELRRLKIYACGDTGGVPAMLVTCGSSGTGDGTNHVYFQQSRFVYNYGGTVFRNHHASATIRRCIFSDCQFHGRSHASTGDISDHDLITLEGGVSTIEMHGCIVNGSGVAPLAIIRTKESATSLRDPQGLIISNMSAAETVGDVLAVEQLSDLAMSGRFATASIDGAVLRVGASSGLLCFDVRAVGAVAFGSAPTTKFVIPSGTQANGAVTWGGKTITPSTA